MAQKMTAKERRVFEAGRRLGYALGYTCGWHRALWDNKGASAAGKPRARLAYGKARLRYTDAEPVAYNPGDRALIGHVLKGRRP